MVGDENNERVGIRILAVAFDSGELLITRAAAKKTLYATHEEHLEWGHQRGGAGAVENLREIVFCEIELEQAEIAEIRRDEVLDDGVAKALAKGSLRDSSSLTKRSAWAKARIRSSPRDNRWSRRCDIG
jgi:hypothetical protein